jgi:hypothetical protein
VPESAPAPAPAPAAALPSAPAASPAPAGTLARPRRVWDLVLTIIGIIGYLALTALASASWFLLVFAGDSCGASSVCNYDQIGNGISVVLWGVWVPTLFVLAGSIVLLVTRRIAFWVPLVGALLTIAIAVVGFALVVSAVQPA